MRVFEKHCHAITSKQGMKKKEQPERGRMRSSRGNRVTFRPASHGRMWSRHPISLGIVLTLIRAFSTL